MAAIYFTAPRLSWTVPDPDLAGQTFGRWLVLKLVGEDTRTNKHGTYRRGYVWLCRCTCGTERAVLAESLVRKITEGCGCKKLESIRTHGMSHTRLYKTWHNMLSKTRNPNNSAYYLYGARGIKVCDEWYSFENFFQDMGYPPEGHSLDRIDNDGDYSKENCRWATSDVQQNNKRTNHFITVGNITLTISQWATQTGLTQHTIRGRAQRGWKPEDIVSPVHRKSGRPRLIPITVSVPAIVKTTSPNRHVILNDTPAINVKFLGYPTFIRIE